MNVAAASAASAATKIYSERFGFFRPNGIRKDLAGIEVSTLVAWTSENTTGTSAERLAVQRIAQMTGATLAMDSRVIPRAKVSEIADFGTQTVRFGKKTA